MFAQAFHPAMKYAAVPRKEIGIRTVFNILGPLTNPAHAQYQVIGVPSEEIGNTVARALHHLHINRALVVHGLNGVAPRLSISAHGRHLELRARRPNYLFDTFARKTWG